MYELHDVSISPVKCAQESKKQIAVLIQTHMWSWNKVKVIKPGMNLYAPSKVIIMQSLKALALTVSQKKVTLKLFHNNEIHQLSPLYMCENKAVLCSWSTWRYQHSYKVSTKSDKKTKFSLTLLWPWNIVKFT